MSSTTTTTEVDRGRRLPAAAPAPPYAEPVDDHRTCVIAGGGPAGMMLGLLLARGGVRVTVLEKHADFLRDFRGDTVHPSTLQLLDDLGLGDRFAALPQSHVEQVRADAPDGRRVTVIDFSRLRHRHPHIAMVPQWDLLDLIAEAGRAEPCFELRMQTEVTGLVRSGDRVTGVRFRGPDGPGELAADLVVGADGRWSRVRAEAGLETREVPVPIDVWWFRVDGETSTPTSLLPHIRHRVGFIQIPRRGYVQMARVGLKGTDAAFRAAGADALYADLARAVPELAEAARAVTMDDVKLLDVRVNRLRRWHAPGVLCLGDAAHAMSPVGGVGINLAVQDAVAAARILAAPLREGRLGDRDLDRVRRRRTPPTWLVQTGQRGLHRVLRRVLEGRSDWMPPPRALALAARVPALTVVPAYLVGVGLRPEPTPDFARRPNDA